MLQEHGIRLGRLDWKRIPDDGVRAGYARLDAALGQRVRTERERASAMNIMHYFMLRYNDGIDNLPHPADLSTLNHFQEGEERARRAWQELVERQQWRPTHLRDTRTKLSHALFLLDERLAEVVNPVMRKAHRSGVVFENRRAQTRSFTLHDCVPMAVRQKGTDTLQYRLLCDLGKDMAPHLRGVSVGNMKAVLLFLNALLFGNPEAGGASIWLVGVPNDPGTARADLRHLTPKQWLDRYGCICARDRRVSFDLFRKEIRLIRILHADVLHVHKSKDFVCIPVPKTNAWRCNEQDAQRAAGSSTGSTLNTSAGSSELEVAARQRRQTLRDTIAVLRGNLCHRIEEDCEQAGAPMSIDMGASDRGDSRHLHPMKCDALCVRQKVHWSGQLSFCSSARGCAEVGLASCDCLGPCIPHTQETFRPSSTPRRRVAKEGTSGCLSQPQCCWRAGSQARSAPQSEANGFFQARTPPNP